MTVKAVQHKIQDLSAHPNCLGVVSSVCLAARGMCCDTTRSTGLACAPSSSRCSTMRADPAG
eukprot:4563610-Prymnesium_polylepis.1